MSSTSVASAAFFVSRAPLAAACAATSPALAVTNASRAAPQVHRGHRRCRIGRRVVLQARLHRLCEDHNVRLCSWKSCHVPILRVLNGLRRSSVGRKRLGGGPIRRKGRLQSSIAGLQSPVAGLQSPVAGLQSPVAGLHSPTAGLQSPIAGLHSPTAGLQSPIAGLQLPIAGLQLAVAGVQHRVAGLQHRVVGVQWGVGGFNSGVPCLHRGGADME